MTFVIKIVVYDVTYCCLGREMPAYNQNGVEPDESVSRRIGKCKIATRAGLVEARPPVPSTNSGYGYRRAEGTFSLSGSGYDYELVKEAINASKSVGFKQIPFATKVTHYNRLTLFI